ncbi:MAG: APC family permease [Candidatus Villigracilaceae bacterium]
MLSEEHPNPIIHRKAEVHPPRDWRTWLFGPPLATADAPHQTIGKAIGLAVFASDALSSTAYASQEILFILAAAGSGAFRYVFPISLVIVGLLFIVAISYEQTIHAYPDGGGSYIVSRDNLGQMVALVAGSALLTDYILTVAVSISSGVAQIVSAFPQFFPYRVLLAVGFVWFMTLINLRGVKESGAIFAVPTYFFITTMAITVGIGLYKHFTGTLGQVIDPPEIEVTQTLITVTPFLLLHAFSSGTAALTGIEAISDGITAFKEPRSRNAGITLVFMAIILSTLFLGISFLSGKIGATPSEVETVISQLSRTVFSRDSLWYLMGITATTVILIMAANTAFADFPRLSSIIARDRFLPHQLFLRNGRLVFSYGIVTLALIASLLIIIFQASVNRLIPLYAVGVFMSFTLSQGGMARRWWKIGHLNAGETLKERGSVLKHDKRWAVKMIINGLGALCTFMVMIIFAVTKFVHGAWVVLILIPSVVAFFLVINRHYTTLAEQLSLENFVGQPLRAGRHRVLLLISTIHRGSWQALAYARRLSDDVTAVHVSLDPEESEKVRQKWQVWGEGVRLIILESPYRLLMEPLLKYIEEMLAIQEPGEILTIVVPQFIPSKKWHALLHTNTADTLRERLLSRPGIVITEVPYQVP